MEKIAVERLVKARGYTRAKVTRLCSAILEAADSSSDVTRRFYSDKLTALKSELVDYDKQIFTAQIQIGVSDEVLQSLSNEAEDYEDKIGEAFIYLQINPNRNESLRQNHQDNLNFSDRDKTHLKLPEVPLPQFSGEKGENFQKFINGFEAIIDKHNLSDYEKFVFLRKQLSGGAKILVDTLDFDEQKYVSAKEILTTAFDSNLRSKFYIISELSKINLPENENPFSFIGKMRTIMAGLKNLKISVDEIAQYFIWNGLNKEFQSHLISITNKSIPKMTEISDNIFEATERYMKEIDQRKKDASKNKVKVVKNNEYSPSVNAVNVKSEKSKIFCVLCSSDKNDSAHYLKNCKVYDNPKKKFDKLRSIKACSKCSFRNHESKNCKFEFKSNCRFCNGQHMSYLCLKSMKMQNEAQSNTIEIQKDETTNNILLVEVAQSSLNAPVILPTFTTFLNSKYGRIPVRVFKDSGSQRTFVCQSIVDHINAPIINEHVSLKIQGFNSDKKIDTQLVGLNIEIGGLTHEITAICVDHIRTKFDATGIDTVIKEFKRNKYEIADKQYIENRYLVDNIDIILGTDFDPILPMKYISYGDHLNPSSYIASPVGVIFSGKLDNMINNLPFLTNKTSCEIDASKLSKASKLTDIIPEYENCNVSEIIPVSQDTSDANDVPFAFENTRDSPPVPFGEGSCSDELDYVHIQEEMESELNLKITDFVLNNIKQDESGRIVAPLIWNHKNCHLLAKNYKLSYNVLQSNLKKLSKEPEKLKLYDQVIKDQLELGVIDKIDNIDQFMNEHPECSFLAHSGVFRMKNESTKCRIVFMSNLAEKKGQPAISHNQAILAGPNLNHSITAAINHLRFDRYLLTFDIAKAYLGIKLNECDSNRLLFLWFNNIEKSDYKVIALRNRRLSFGLKCSSSILTLVLYFILIMTKDEDDHLNNIKRQIYNSFYVDNGGFTSNNESEITACYNFLPQLFGVYNLNLQQFFTNSKYLQTQIDCEVNKSDDCIKFFGMIWCRSNDKLSPMKINLNEYANTKRKILSSLNSIYDIFNIYGPILLRARLFLQKVHSDKSVTWDSPIKEDYLKEWRLITKQANDTPQIEIIRSVGSRDSDYELIGFSDASMQAIGVVIYIKDNKSGKLTFLAAKCKLVQSNSKRKMPSLELLAISIGTDFLQETSESFCGTKVVNPINISKLTLFTDSLVCLHWLENYSIKFEKMKNVSVFAKNKLKRIDESCRKNSITFRHVAGAENPADYLTRPCSYRIINKSNFYTGPALFDLDQMEASDIFVTLPNPICRKVDEIPSLSPLQNKTLSDEGHSIVQRSSDQFNNNSPFVEQKDPESNVNSILLQENRVNVTSGDQNVIPNYLHVNCKHVIDLNKYESFSRYKNILLNVHRFLNNIKRNIRSKNSNSKLAVINDTDLYAYAISKLISIDQRIFYPDVFEYIESNDKVRYKIPTILTKLNLYKDDKDVLRVRSKFPQSKYLNPILLHRNSVLTRKIIRETHVTIAHGGLYHTLRELKKNFYVPKFFSTVKNVLKNCITCRKVNKHPIKINQNAYRDFRINPPKIPFKSIYLDYIGPFTVKFANERKKSLHFGCNGSMESSIEFKSVSNRKLRRLPASSTITLFRIWYVPELYLRPR